MILIYFNYWLREDEKLSFPLPQLLWGPQQWPLRTLWLHCRTIQGKIKAFLAFWRKWANTMIYYSVPDIQGNFLIVAVNPHCNMKSPELKCAFHRSWKLAPLARTKERVFLLANVNFMPWRQLCQLYRILQRQARISTDHQTRRLQTVLASLLEVSPKSFTCNLFSRTVRTACQRFLVLEP